MSAAANVTEPVQALVVVDAQNAFMTGEAAVPAGETLIKSLDDLLRRARACHAVVIHLQNVGSPGAADEPHQPGWELYFPAVPSDTELVIRKTKDDGFDDTSLAEVLAKHGVKRIAIGGVMSEMCVAATARAALARGLGVVIPHDAHATYNIPAAPGISGEIPAPMASRVAEWSLGDQVEIVAGAAEVTFVAAGL